MIKTPIKPANMAIIRERPITSLRKMTAIIVKISGAVCIIAVTVDKAELARATTKARPPTISLTHLNIVALCRYLLSNTGCPVPSASSQNIAAVPAPKTIRICPTGRPGDNNFINMSTHVNRKTPVIVRHAAL